jgi:phage-related protein
MPLSSYQFIFGSFTFGAGTPFAIIDVDGLESLPDVRSQDDDRGYNDGSYSGRDFLASRTLTFTINTFAGNGNNAQQNYQLLQAALVVQQNGTTPLQFKLSPSDIEQLIYGRVRTNKTLVDPEYTYGFIRSQITIYCPDPRYYSNTATTAALVPTAALGRTYNRDYNLTYGGGSLNNATAIINAGSWITYPVITITGPVQNPTIGNITTNQYMTINTSLANTDTLVIDLNQKLVTLNGVSARNLVAGNSQWFGAPVGTTYFSFTGTQTVLGITSATVVYRSAYI